MQNFGQIMPREREVVSIHLSSLRTCLVPGDWVDGIGVERGVRYIEERLQSWT